MPRGKQEKDIHAKIKTELRQMERFGEKRHGDDKLERQKSGIYSFNTARMYNRECQKFADWVCERSPEGRFTSLKTAKEEYAKDYIQMRNADPNISAYTVKLQRSALAKLFQCDAKEFGKVDSRVRADITRSRNRAIISEKTGKEIKNPHKNAGHFSERNHADIVEFARGTGLRRFELAALRGYQLDEKNQCLHVKGKGGRERDVPIIGDHAQEIMERCRAAGDNKVWEHVPQRMDVHNYRSEYANRMYKMYARDINKIPEKDKYTCTKDLKGVVYDKKAMQKVTSALGHNRISVIAENYLR